MGWQWNNVRSATQLPVRLWANDPVNLRAKWNLDANNFRGNVAYDMWVHEAWQVNDGLDWRDQPSDEIMVWLDHDDLNPIGSYQKDVRIAGRTWQLWRGTHPEGWNVYSFRLKGNATKNVNLRLRDFLHNLMYVQNWLSNSKYLTSVQFGPEVWQGDGVFDCNSYRVNVR